MILSDEALEFVSRMIMAEGWLKLYSIKAARPKGRAAQRIKPFLDYFARTIFRVL